MVQLNELAPDFCLPGDDGVDFRLSDHRGERLLLVFYPGDGTPVCTAQLCEYRDGIEAFSDLGVRLIGISPDGEDSHRRFREKHQFSFELLSDEKLEVADVIVEEDEDDKDYLGTNFSNSPTDADKRKQLPFAGLAGSSMVMKEPSNVSYAF